MMFMWMWGIEKTLFMIKRRELKNLVKNFEIDSGDEK